MNYAFLAEVPLFAGCTPDQAEEVLRGLKHRVRRFQKEEIIFSTGDIVQELGIVLEGSARIENIDIFGNRSILGFSEKGDVFAESYACLPGQPLMVDVVAGENSEILFLNVQDLITEKMQRKNSKADIVLVNLLRIASRKNQRLSMRIFHSTPKTIRDRLYSYFSEQATLAGNMEFSIPMDRQQLADYLGVDRTALSKELGKMRDEGLLEYRKNHFKVLA